MTEKELRQQVCRKAESWLGLREADGGHRQILRVYNAIRPLPRGYEMGEGDPWCAAFVSAVGAACGLTSVLLPECGCEPMIALYRAAGRWEEADEAIPRPGDLIFYDWQDAGAGDCRGEADHVGLITAVEGDLLTVVEGNLSDAVGERRLYAGARFIRGFARPDYASAATAEGAASAPVSPSAPASPSGGGVSEADGRGEDSGTDAPIGLVPRPLPPEGEASAATVLPILRRGDKGKAVQAGQLLLIARGYRCGPWGADGDFGPATYGAVYRFQQGKKLLLDGEIGPQTWSALVGEREQ